MNQTFKNILEECKSDTDKKMYSKLTRSDTDRAREQKKKDREWALETKLSEIVQYRDEFGNKALDRFMEARDLDGLTAVVKNQATYSTFRTQGGMSKWEEPESRLQIAPDETIIYHMSKGIELHYKLTNVEYGDTLINKAHKADFSHVIDTLGRAFVCIKGTYDGQKGKNKNDAPTVSKGDFLAVRYSDWQMLDENSAQIEKTVTESLERASRNSRNK